MAESTASSRTLAGWQTGRPSASAAAFTGVGINFIPLFFRLIRLGVDSRHLVAVRRQALKGWDGQIPASP